MIHAHSKSKHDQFASVKEDNNTKKGGLKKNGKNQSNIKNGKSQGGKIGMVHSSSKTKLTLKPNKNNQNINNLNLHQNLEVHLKKPTIQVHKKQPKKQQKKSASKERLVKSKSMTKLNHGKSQITRLSPLPTKEDEKSKYHTLKPEKKEQKKMKKSKSKISLINTKRQGQTKRSSIRTEMSSKFPSVIRQQQKIVKPKPKAKYLKPKINANKTKMQNLIHRSIMYSQVSFQDQLQPYPSQPSQHQHRKMVRFIPPKNVKTEGRCESQTFHGEINKAAITIQRWFRGYIVRKYLSQAKYIIQNVKKIQRCWRKYRNYKRTKLHPKKQLSLSSSLITVKDFNDSLNLKQQRSKYLQPELPTSNRKLDLREIIKNILEEDSVGEQIKQKVRQIDQSQKRQTYVKTKIDRQIHSEKIFNSPRGETRLVGGPMGKMLNSPIVMRVISPTNCKTPKNFSIRDVLMNSHSHSKLSKGDLLISPRIPSPAQMNLTPMSHRQPQSLPFQTSFPFIIEFCMKVISYLRDEQDAMNRFQQAIQGLTHFKSDLILKGWNKFPAQEQQASSQSQLLPTSQFYYQEHLKPTIFTATERKCIFQYSPMLLFLYDSSYPQFSPNKSSQDSLAFNFLNAILDCFEEALYNQFRYLPLNKVPTRQGLSLISIQWSKLFQNLMARTVSKIHQCSQTLCGAVLQEKQEEEMKWIIAVNEQRLQEMAKAIQPWDFQSGMLGISLQISQAILQDLLGQLFQVQ